MSKEELFKKLNEAVIASDSQAVVEAAKQVLEKGIDPVEAIEKGLSKGAITVGEKFDKMKSS